MMARLAERPVKAFTIGFADGDVADERPAARAAAEAVGAEHVEIVFDEADFWRLLPQIVAGGRRPGRRLRDPADLGAGPGGAPGRAQGHPVGRGRRRAVRRLWPLSQRHAAVVGGRPDAARARHARRARRVARRDRRLARRHRRRRGAGRRPGPHAAAGGASGRLRRLAAERSVDQARPLPDGAWRRRPHPVSRHRRWRRSPFACPTSSRSSAGSANGCCAAGSPITCRRRGRSPASAALRCRWRTGSRAAPTRSARSSPARRRCAKSAGPTRSRACLPPPGKSAPAAPPGTCCSTRCGTAATSNARPCRPIPWPRWRATG